MFSRRGAEIAEREGFHAKARRAVRLRRQEPGRAQRFLARPSGSVWTPACAGVHPKLKPGRKRKNDAQKNQWGGKSVNNGRELDADVNPIDEDWFDVVMRVKALPGEKQLTDRVRFHLHQSFKRDVVTVRPKDGVAQLKRYAWGAFTIGAEVEGEPDTFLELDMAAPDFDAPITFKSR